MKARRYMVGKGLTMAQVRAKLAARRVPDFRALNYDSRTGWVLVI